MNKILSIVCFGVFSLLVVGCDDDEGAILAPDQIPATPQGVFSITGDNVVWVVFNGIYEIDVKEYVIWRSLDPVTNFAEIGTVAAIDNPNLDLIIYQFADSASVNGTTYYYAVSSVDFANQVSELSAENVFDTPRPEGNAILVSNDMNNGNFAGFALAAGSTIDDDDINADIYIDRFQGNLFINAGNFSSFFGDIQDMGFTEDFDAIGFAPDSGWSAVGFYELILGHTYVIRTAEGNFAKMRLDLMDLATGLVRFDWAYQTVIDNRELSPGIGGRGGQPRRDKAETLSAITAVEQ